MRVLGLLVVVLCATTAVADDEAPLPEVASALGRIADGWSVDITSTGRKTGKPHTRPIWYVVEDGKILVQAGKDGRADWYRNLQKTPVVTLKADRYTFRARARLLTDPKDADRVRALFLDKYTSAWLLSWVGSGIGQGLPVELTVESVAVSR